LSAICSTWRGSNPARSAPNLDWHDARDLVQTTLRELQRELAGHPVKLEMPTAPLLVRLDFSLMLHALANLLLNAANHTPASTVIEIQVQLADGNLSLRVADRVGREFRLKSCRASLTNSSARRTRHQAAVASASLS
jgi:nitrogen fixation/metabolism regulation signal transduction histidine kinase